MTEAGPYSLDGQLLQALEQAAGKSNLLTDPAECWPYGYDNSRQHAAPLAVVFAESEQQLCNVVRFCHKHGIPLTSRGRGSGTTGATVPVRGGIVVSTERMDRILELNPDDRYMRVQPGITNQAVQKAAAEYGYFWAPDPTSAAFCTVGGNLAYNSAGPRAVKYGTPRENTLGLRAIDGLGNCFKTGVTTTKGVVGYDLTRLLIGSEGTLALITEATLKLLPLPEGKRTIQAFYRDINSAAVAVSAIMAQPTIPCALEFIDGNAINMVRDDSSVELPENAGALLMIEVDGNESDLEAASRSVTDAAGNDGLLSIRVAHTNDEIEALWATRKALSPALRKVAPKKINEDVVVPVSKIPQLINGLDQLSKQFGIPIINFGHAGNGNIHTNLLINPDDPKQMKNADACLDRVFSLVLELDGTISGEHGIGLVKMDYVDRELDATSLRLMHQIKHEFDPGNILNPGKMIPDRD